MSPATPTRPGDAAVVSASGPVVRARIPGSAAIGEVVRVGPRRLLAEVIRVDGEIGTLQVYEETGGLRVGDPVRRTGAPLVAWLGSPESRDVSGRVFEVKGGMIGVSDGWRDGQTIDKGARWEPDAVGAAVSDLIAKASAPQKVFGT